MNELVGLREAQVQIDASHEVVRRLGHWTTARRFLVRARRSAVVIDLRSRLIPAGEVEIELDATRSTVKLLVPDQAEIDEWALAFDGRGRVKRTFHDGRIGGGRKIRLTGSVRNGDVRVLSGGPAQLSVIFSRQFFVDARRANAAGRVPDLHDPAAHR